MSQDRQLVVNLALETASVQSKIKNINADTKQLKSAFENAGAGIKDFEKTSEGATAKLKLLEGTLENTRKKLDIYKRKLEENKETLDKTSKAFVESKNKVNDLKNKLEESEKAFGKNSDEVKQLKDELKQAETAMNNKAKAVVSAEDKLKGLNTTINKTEAECKDLEAQIRDVNDELNDIDSGNVDKMSGSFKEASRESAQLGADLVIVGSGFKNVGDGMMDAGVKALETIGKFVEVGASAGEMQSKFDIVFKTTGGSVEEWAKTHGNAIGRSSLELKEYVSNSADLMIGMGMAEDTAGGLSQKYIELAYDLASFNNVNDGTALEAMTKAMMGETEMAKQLGVNLSVATMENSEYVQSLGKKWSEMTQAEKAEAYYAEAVKQSTNAFGDAERTADSYTNQMKRLDGQKKDLMKTIGEKLIPILEPLIQKINDVVGKLVTWAEENPEIVRTLTIIAGIVATVATVIGALLIPIGTAIIAFGAISTVLAGTSIAFAPIIAVIASVIGIVIILAMSIKENFDGIKKAVQDMISKCQPQFEQFKESFSRLWETCKSIYEVVVKPIFKMIGEVIEQCIKIATPILQVLMTVFSAVFDTISIIWEGIGKPVFEFIMSIVQAVWEKFQPVFASIQELFGKVAGAISSVWNNILKPVFEFLIEIVRKIGEKVAPVFEQFKDDICRAMDAVLEPIDWVISKLSDLFGWLGDVSGKVGDFLSKINPFKDKKMAVGVDVEANGDLPQAFVMRNPDMDNIALSGGYSSANTRQSRDLQPYIQASTGSFKLNGFKDLENIAKKIESKMGSKSGGVHIDNVTIAGENDVNRALDMMNFFARV